MERIEDHIGMLNKIAIKAHKRYVAMGITTHEVEDIVGELALVFMKAQEAFNAESGYKFSTYFYTSAWNHVNRFIDKHLRNNADAQAMSMDVEVEEGASLHEVISSDALTPEQQAMQDEIAMSAFARMSSLTKKVVMMTREPSKELLDAWNAKQAFALRHRELGFGERRAPRRITIGFVCAFYGINKNVQTKIMNEVKDIANEVAA